MQASSFFVGPHKTPQGVKWLILLTVTISFLSPIATFFLESYWRIPGPGAWLSLSLFGLQQGWLWQPFTYFFLHSSSLGLSITFFLSLFFQMFLLWISGSEINLRFGTKSLLIFYLSAGLFSGIIAACTLFIFSSSVVLFGAGPPINALIIVWVMLYPELELFFFFLIRIKVKWLVAIFLGFSLLVNLSYGTFVPFLADTMGIIWGFFYGHFIWKLNNPYPLNLAFPFHRKKKEKENKIIDISAFQESDEAFIDRMLDKITKKGSEALTKKESDRMKKISEKKRRQS